VSHHLIGPTIYLRRRSMIFGGMASGRNAAANPLTLGECPTERPGASPSGGSTRPGAPCLSAASWPRSGLPRDEIPSIKRDRMLSRRTPAGRPLGADSRSGLCPSREPWRVIRAGSPGGRSRASGARHGLRSAPRLRTFPFEIGPSPTRVHHGDDAVTAGRERRRGRDDQQGFLHRSAAGLLRPRCDAKASLMRREENRRWRQQRIVRRSVTSASRSAT
jgi:hypothetical protein